MFFFNLGLGEFLILFTAASALVTALYLLDRSRRHLVVSTLRFWTSTERPVESTRRRRIKQWGSLLLQLLAILLLLLALSQLRLGSPDQTSLDHILILDTSSWMAARARGDQPLLEEAKTLAVNYVRAVPSSDRVLVLYADALTTPATSFDSDRKKLEAAINRAQPSNAALDLRQAFDFARRMQGRTARRPGEIVFAGAGRTADAAADLNIPPNLRVLPVAASGSNIGLRRIGLRRSASESDLWNIYVSLRNYGARPRNVDLGVQFGGAPVGNRTVTVAPNTEQEAAFELRTRVAGFLEARIRSAGDAFPGDDRAVLELPSLPLVQVTVCTDQPAIFRPLLGAHPNVQATYQSAAACNPSADAVAIFDRVTPPAQGSNQRRVYIEPPAAASPVPVKLRAASATLRQWQVNHPLGAGLRASGLSIIGATVFSPRAGDTVILDSSEGPLMVAHDQDKVAVLGFHPARALPYELTTPLVFANLLRWLSPDSFRRWEMYATSIGAVSVPLESADTTNLRVVDVDQTELPYSVQGNTLRFFAGRPGTVRVIQGDREQIYSLAIPAVPDQVWSIPGTARRGVPRPRAAGSSSVDIWYWLAAAAGCILLFEWLRYSPRGGILRRSPATAPAGAAQPLRRAS